MEWPSPLVLRGLHQPYRILRKESSQSEINLIGKIVQLELLIGDKCIRLELSRQWIMVFGLWPICDWSRASNLTRLANLTKAI